MISLQFLNGVASLLHNWNSPGRKACHSAAILILVLLFCVSFYANLIKMSSRRSIQHPELDLVRLRPMKNDEDLPTVQEHMLPADFGR